MKRKLGNWLIKMGFALNGRAVKQQVFRPGEYEAMVDAQQKSLADAIMVVIAGESQLIASLVEAKVRRTIDQWQFGPEVKREVIELADRDRRPGWERF